jgi:hypothetical protein
VTIVGFLLTSSQGAASAFLCAQCLADAERDIDLYEASALAQEQRMLPGVIAAGEVEDDDPTAAEAVCNLCGRPFLPVWCQWRDGQTAR